MDEKSGMNFSEYVAILSGNTDLLEKAKVEKKIAVMESERQAFNRSRGESRLRLDGINHSIAGCRGMIDRIEGDMAILASREQLNEEGKRLNPISLTGVEGSDPKQIGAKLAEFNTKARTHGQDMEIGSLYGFRIVVKTEISSSNADLFEGDGLATNKFAIVGESGIRYTHNNGNIAADPELATASFLHALDKMQPMVERYEKERAKLAADIPILQELQRSTWRKEEELKALKTELATIERKIQLSLKPIEQGEQQEEKKQEQAAPTPDDPPLTITPSESQRRGLGL